MKKVAMLFFTILQACLSVNFRNKVIEAIDNIFISLFNYTGYVFKKNSA